MNVSLLVTITLIMGGIYVGLSIAEKIINSRKAKKEVHKNDGDSSNRDFVEN